ncbi:MAG: TetR/AcrR family transcriptional regulator [Dermatophilaceae bacterium]
MVAGLGAFCQPLHVTRRPGQHHGDLRPALVAAAVELLENAGTDALTLREVARRAGVSPGAPYHHFADKAAILSAVATDGFRRLGEEQAAVRARDPLDRVEALTGAYVRFAIAHRAHYSVMFAALHASPGQEPSTPSAAASTGPDVDLVAAAFDTFDTLVEAVAAVDPLRDATETRRRALLVWAQAHGTVGIADAARRLDDRYDAGTLAADAGRAARALLAARAPDPTHRRG